MLVAVAGFNVSLYRRYRAATAARAAWTSVDFDAAITGQGVPPEIAQCVRRLVRPWYGMEVVPHPDDRLGAFLGMDAKAVADIAAQGARELGLAADGKVPKLATVGDLARYLGRRCPS